MFSIKGQPRSLCGKLNIFIISFDVQTESAKIVFISKASLSAVRNPASPSDWGESNGTVYLWGSTKKVHLLSSHF
jgi:hypothetical protein